VEKRENIFRNFRAILLLGALFGFLFYFSSHQSPATQKNKKQVNTCESFSTGLRPAISGNQNIRIVKSLPFSPVPLDFCITNLQAGWQNDFVKYSNAHFLLIKPLLSQNIFHQHFASGLDGPPLVA